MKNSKFAQFALDAKALKTVKGGNQTFPPVSTSTQVNDFNSSRSNRERGN
jgi:hypothetical protein